MTLYQIDAFTDHLFVGNPAAVIVLDSRPTDQLMQAIANENNLAETAYVIPEGDDFHIRWFTPAVEVDLCGHATLAAAYVMFNQLGYSKDVIRFQSRSGWLSVQKNGSWLTPYWAHRLGKNELTARQVSPRGGYLKCINKNDRVLISGQAVMYMKGEIEMNNE